MDSALNWDPENPRESLTIYFQSLPDQQDRAYELSLTKTAETCPPAVFDACRQLVADSNAALPDRFASLFLLGIHLRRFMSFTEFAELLDDHGSAFAGQPMYQHLAALMYAGRGAPGDVDQALELSRLAAKSLPGHVGAQHAFAVNVATAAEGGRLLDPDVMSEARKAISVAIGLEPRYAKFHCTRGRLLAVEGDFEGARASIRKAMDLEDEKKSDYSLRIGTYQYHLAQVSMTEMHDTLGRQVTEAKAEVEENAGHLLKQVDDLRSQNLTTLGLFTAILSFTLGSLQIAQGQTFNQAARLIVVMAGSILMVYGLFLLVVRRLSEDSIWPMIALSILGALVVLAALSWSLS